MGGVLTKKHDNSHVLALCRERKRLLKLAVENRDAFAVAQCKYNNSLLTLSKAMRLFVAKHSASASHSSQNNDKNTPFSQQKPKKPTNDTVDPRPNPDPADSLASSEVTEESQKQEENARVDRKQKGIVVEDDGSKEGDNSDDDGAACEQFYDKMVPEMLSMEGETSHGWDFFDPYAHVVSALGVNSEYYVRKFREFEGIPDLEHGMEEVLICGEKFESVYKSVVGHVKSEVSHVAVEVVSNESLGECRMGLKAKEKPQIFKSVGGVKIGKDKNENVAEKKDSENESEISDDEVKMKEEEEGEENMCSDETKNLTVIETPNNGRDLLKAFEEIEGLFHTAYEAGLDVSKMLEASRFQLQTGLRVWMEIIVAIFIVMLPLSLRLSLRNGVHVFLSILLLRRHTLNLSMLGFPQCSGPEPEEAEDESEEIPSAPEFRIHGPPLISVCHEWLASTAKLPDKEVMNSLKGFEKKVKALSVQQWKEQKQKKKIDLLVREFDRKVSALQREENKILKLKESRREVDGDFQDRMECLEERKMSLEEIRHKIELEKAKHMSGMEETHRATLAGFQTGFSAVLESLVDFSKATVKMYDDLSAYIENAKATAENSVNNPSN
ncbi:DUF632 domain-containing protein/DUF630 domain-containing protein [Melia azedarach]|uniref:DUF632 domain-containing protein/DUF630 domain-containing protein n=1 Tax=Melia azedarach TaxID=155640 RepID=A0ACC1XRJ7_MELAZ|nr:DUF632 domain-containing protein/DUF630 domain-containing protein [Melia azedarach]